MLPSCLPHRLHDRLAGPAGDDRLGAAREVAHGEHRVVPRHGRVVPGDPGEPVGVRGQARGGDEVGPADQHLRLARRPRVETDDLIDHLGGRGALARVVLAHADEPRAVGRDVAVGEAVAPRDRGLRGQDDGLSARGVAAQALVGPVDGEDGAVVQPPRPAAVLVDRGAGVGVPGQQVGHRAPIGVLPFHAAHQLDPAALAGAPLAPHDAAAPVGAHAVEPHPRSDDELRGDRCRPGSVGQRGHGATVGRHDRRKNTDTGCQRRAAADTETALNPGRAARSSGSFPSTSWAARRRRCASVP